ncbi:MULTISPECIES: helix-turn-helix domain-containing protein [Methylobacterium]|nr:MULTISPECIES: helix-turn-helix transcriptional regulator [Methylobacterium]TXN24699.1 helix-turn-helix transcriptional regulator [Methylobacterium sp. WL9]
MNAQTIVTPAGERLVMLSEADFKLLAEAAEDNADRLAVQEYRRRLAAGEEELVPSEIVDRLLSGESRIRVWREHRGMTAKVLAEEAGIAQPFLSQIETGKREGTVDTLRSLADALGVTIDDLVG